MASIATSNNNKSSTIISSSNNNSNYESYNNKLTIPRGLIEKECITKSKYNGLPAHVSSEGLPPPSISYQKKGGLYIWGRMADDSEVSALNTNDIEDGTKKGGATGKFGFRKLAFLCGAMSSSDKKGESQLAESAQFVLSFDNVNDLKAENIKKVCGGESQIIIFTKDDKLYSCGYGTSALYKSVDDAKGEIIPIVPSMEENLKRKISVHDIECGAEHTVISCTNIDNNEIKNNNSNNMTNRKTRYKLYNFGGSQYFHPIPLLNVLDKDLFCCQGQGNMAIAHESKNSKDNGKLGVYLWKNDAEGEVHDVELSAKMKQELAFKKKDEDSVMNHRGVRDGIAEPVSALKRRGSMYTILSANNADNNISNDGDDTVERSSYNKLINNMKQVACGERSILALTNDGRIYSSGNDDGTTQITFSDDGASKSIFKRVKFPESAKRVKAKCIKVANGGRHFAALFDDGKLFMWGRNQYGQVTSSSLNNGIDENSNNVDFDENLSKIFFSLSSSRAFIAEPVEVVLRDDFLIGSTNSKENNKYLENVQLYIKDVVCGKMHTTALTSSGQVFSWGRIPGATDHNPAYPYPDLAGQYVLKIGSAPMFSIAVVQRPRLKIEGRIIDEKLNVEQSCNMMDCKRAKFGKQSNYSSMHLPVICVTDINGVPKIDSSTSMGKALLVSRPAAGFPESTSFGTIAYEACQAGAKMLIFCCQKKDGKADLPVRAKMNVGDPLEKEIHIPVISVNQESGEYLGCPNNISTIQDGNNQIIVRLCWFGDGQ